MAIEEVVDWETTAKANSAVHPVGPQGREASRTSLSFQELQAAIARWRDTLGGGGTITVEDEGTPLTTAADTLNFVGNSVVASGTGTTKTITIADAAAAGSTDEIQYNVSGDFTASPNFKFIDNAFNPVLELGDELGNIFTPTIELRASTNGGGRIHFYENGTQRARMEFIPSVGGDVDVVRIVSNVGPVQIMPSNLVTGDFTGEGLELHKGGLKLTSQTSAPWVDELNHGQLYMKTSDGIPYWVNDVGAEFSIIDSGSIGGSIADNQIAVGAATADDIEGSAALTFDGTELFTSGLVQIEAADPRLRISESDASANNKNYQFRAFGNTLSLQFYDDAWSSGANVFNFVRALNVLTEVTVNSNSLRMNSGGGTILFQDAAASLITGVQAGRSKLWVRNDTPSVLVFEDDAGTEWDLNVAAGDLWSDPVDSSITVDTDSTYDIGTDTVRHATIYADEFNVNTGGNFVSNTVSSFGLKFSTVDEWAFRATRNGGAELFYNNAVKAETVTDGFNVTGDLRTSANIECTGSGSMDLIHLASSQLIRILTEDSVGAAHVNAEFGGATPGVILNWDAALRLATNEKGVSIDGQVLTVGTNAPHQTHLSTLEVVEVGLQTYLLGANNTGGSHFMRGAYHNGTNWVKDGTEEVSALSFLGTGNIKLRTAVAGVADDVVSWIDALEVDNASGQLQVSQSIRLTERADHVGTPTATFGEIWLDNGATQALMFTDDAGTDYDLTAGGGGSPWTYTLQTGTSYTAVAGDFVVASNTGTVTITLPSGHSVNDTIIVKKTGATGTVTVDGNASETIDGATTFDLTSQYSSVTLISDGTNWLIV